MSDAWSSYLVAPDGFALRNLAGLTDPDAIAAFERVVSQHAEIQLRENPNHTTSFDLEHLQTIHQRLFADVYAWAGQLRYVDMVKPGGDPFLHHDWIPTYMAAVADQLRADNHLADLHHPGRWADRAAYYMAAATHAHPFREGNGRTIRLWIEDLATHAGHQLDWTRISPGQNAHAARQAATGHYEPMRALLAHVAGADLGVDRPREAFDDLDQGLHDQALAHVGLAHGTPEQQKELTDRLAQLDEHVALVRDHLTTTPAPSTITRSQPPTRRWEGIAVTIDPRLTQQVDWPALAAALDRATATGFVVASGLRALVDAAPLDAEHPARDLQRRLMTAHPKTITPRWTLDDRVNHLPAQPAAPARARPRPAPSRLR